MRPEAGGLGTLGRRTRRRCGRWGRALGVAAAVAGVGELVRADDLAALSDEFDDAATLGRWQQVWQTEGWGADQLEVWSIGGETPGQMLMIPHASTWYQDWRGVLAYQEVAGDFVVTTDVVPRNRAGTGAPGRQFSLAGILVRAPRPSVTSPATWTPGGENYVFLSLGAADQPGSYQYEVKTTLNSVSVLEIEPGPTAAQLQVARIGGVLLMLRRDEGGAWQIHRRYRRPDFPDRLQVGLTTYTDWPTAGSYAPLVHNQTVILEGQPDLRARFDYVRYARPQVPGSLSGQDLADPAAVSDAALLEFLGDAASVPGGASARAQLHWSGSIPGSGSLVVEALQSERSYRLEASPDLHTWSTIAGWVSGGTSNVWEASAVSAGEARFFRVASP